MAPAPGAWEEIPETLGHGLSWSMADSDGDGDLDAFAARHLEMVNDEEAAAGLVSGPGSWLYENRNGGKLVATPEATPEPTHGALGFMGQWLDADGDNDLDLYMANDFGAWVVPNTLLINDGTGRFIDSGGQHRNPPPSTRWAQGWPMWTPTAGPTCTSPTSASPLLILNQGAWVNATASLGAELPPSEQRQSSWGVDLVDLDLDGLPEAVLRFGPLIFWTEVPYVEDSSGQKWSDADAQADALLLNSGEGFQVSEDFQSTEVGRAVIHGGLGPRRRPRPGHHRLDRRGRADPDLRDPRRLPGWGDGEGTDRHAGHRPQGHPMDLACDDLQLFRRRGLPDHRSVCELPDRA